MRIALIGLGEVGRVFAEELSAHDLVAWDIRFSDPASPASINALATGIPTASSAAAAADGADWVISAVTAGNTVDAARDASSGIRTGACFVDLNSASPGAKTAAAQAIESAGGRYVEVAVMSPIEPKRLASPMLCGGPHAQQVVAQLGDLGFSGATFYSDTLGKAAATKLCRSVVVKGMESLVTESMLAARSYGVEDDVLDSLSNLFPGTDWHEFARYLISRSLQHGVRRAEEMEEAAETVAQTDIEPLLAKATASRQAWTAQFSSALEANDLDAMLDLIRKQIPTDERSTL